MADLSWIKFPQTSLETRSLTGLVEPPEEEEDLSWINPGGPPLPVKPKEKPSTVSPYSTLTVEALKRLGKTKTGKSFKRDAENARNDIAYFEAQFGGEEDVDIAANRIKLARTKQREEPIKGGLLKEPLYRGAGVVGGIFAAATSEEAKIGAGAGAIAGGITGAIVAAPASIGPQGLLIEPLSIGAMALKGGGIGWKAGTGIAWYKMAVGRMLYDSIEEEGADPEIAKAITGLIGVPYTLLEMYQVANLTPSMKEAVKQRLNKTLPRIIAHALKKYGKVWSENVAEEIVQKELELTANSLAREYSGQEIPFNKAVVLESLQSLWEEAKGAGTAFAYLPIPGVAFQAGVEAATPGLSPKVAKMVVGSGASQGNLEEILATAKLEKPKEGVKEGLTELYTPESIEARRQWQEEQIRAGGKVDMTKAPPLVPIEEIKEEEEPVTPVVSEVEPTPPTKTEVPTKVTDISPIKPVAETYEDKIQTNYIKQLAERFPKNIKSAEDAQEFIQWAKKYLNIPDDVQIDLEWNKRKVKDNWGTHTKLSPNHSKIMIRANAVGLNLETGKYKVRGRGYAKGEVSTLKETILHELVHFIEPPIVKEGAFQRAVHHPAFKAAEKKAIDDFYEETEKIKRQYHPEKLQESETLEEYEARTPTSVQSLLSQIPSSHTIISLGELGIGKGYAIIDGEERIVARGETVTQAINNFNQETGKAPTEAEVTAPQPDSDQADLTKAVQIADVDPSQVDNVPTAHQRGQVHSLARQMGLDDESRHQLYQETVGKSWDQMTKAEAQTVLDFLKLQVRTLHTQQRAKGLGLTDKESDMLQKLAGNEERYIALLNIMGNIGEMPQDKDEHRFVLDNYKSLAREMNKWAGVKEKGPQFTVFGNPKKHNLLSHWASVRYALGRAEMMTGQSLRLPYENIVMYTKMSRETSFNKVWDIYKSIYKHPTLGGIFFQQNEALRWYLFAPETPEGQQAAQKMNSQTKALADQLQPLLKDYGGLLSGALRFKLWVYKGMVPESLTLMGVQKEELQRIFSEGVKAWNDHTFASWRKTQQWAAKDNYYMSQRTAESFSLDFLNSIIAEPGPKPSGVAVPKGEDIPSEVYAREEEGKLIPAEGSVIDNIIYHFARMNTAIFAMDDLMEFWNNFKKAKPTRDDVAIMKTFMGHALGHGEISTGANKFLGKLFGGGFNRFFWRAYFLNPRKGLWFFIRNLFQNMAYGPSQLGLSEAFKATSDIAFGKGRDQRAADYAEYGKSTISEKQQMFRQAMMVEQGTTATPIRGEFTRNPIRSAAETLRRLGMIADILGNLAVSSDEINRQSAWTIIHRAAQRNVELYRNNKITHKQLISRLKIKTLDPGMRNELQALLTKKKDADFIRQTARYKVENIHFRYETALRSAAEQSNIARATVGLITFQRGTFEIIWHNGLKRMVEGIQNQDYDMAYKGLTNFLNVVFWSGVSKFMLYKIFGKKDYGLFSTLLSFGPISPGLSKLKEWTDGIRRIETEAGTVEEKVNKMMALLAGFTEWAVPLADAALSLAEIQHDEKGITLYRQLKQRLLSRYERLYNRPYTKVDRTEWQKIMHLLIGGFEDPEKEAEMMDSLFGVL